jgi:hypothetical protein
MTYGIQIRQGRQVLIIITFWGTWKKLNH